MTLNNRDDDDLTRAAFAAWFRAGGTAQPSRSSGVVVHKRKKYVRLSSGSTVLAIYRVRPDGMLRRMKRPPAEVETK